MVLEGIAASLLEKYLGEYVSGFKRENLKFSVLSGNAKLENLELKPTALDELDLPVVVKKGYIGELTLKIPWSALSSQAAEVTLKRVLIVAGPKNLGEKWDPQKEEQKRQNQKQKKLLQAELFESAQGPSGDSKKESSGGSDNFATRLIEKIVDNIQVEIEDIHIRYEDDVTVPNQTIAVGVTLERLVAQSTDKNWNPMWLEGVAIVHKVVALRNLAVYWNINDKMVDLSNLTAPMLGSISKESNRAKLNHHYLVNPVSGTLKFKMNKNEMDTSIPRFQFNFQFYELAIKVEDLQFRGAMELAEKISHFQLANQYREFRPSVSIQKNPRAWWKFLGESLRKRIREKRAPMNWASIAERAKVRKEYIPLYQKTKSDKQLTEKEKKRFTKIEERFGTDDLILWRSVAKVMAKKDQKKLTQTKPQAASSGGWFSSWWGSKKETELPTEEKSDIFDLSPDEWKEVYKAVGYNEDQSKSALKVDPKTVKFQVDFHLAKGALELRKSARDPRDDSVTFAKAEWTEFRTGLLIRENWQTINVTLGSINLHDYGTKGTRYPKLAFPEKPQQDFFRLQVDVAPLDPRLEGIDYYAALQVEPLVLVLNRQFLESVANFFKDEVDPLALQELEVRAAARLEKLREESQEQIQLAVASKKVFGIDLAIQAPKIVIPESCTRDGSVILIDGGKLTLQSKIVPKDQRGASPYDLYSIKLRQVNAQIGPTKMLTKSLFAFLPEMVEKYQLAAIDPFDIEIDLNLCKVDSEKFTKLIVEGSLPALRGRISPDKGKQLLAILEAIATEKSDNQEAPAARRATLSNRPIELDPALLAQIVHYDSDKKLHQDKVPLLDSRQIELKFRVPTVTLILNQNYDQNYSEIVVAELVGIGVTFTKRSFDMQAQVYLESLVAEDKLQQFGEEFKYLAKCKRNSQTNRLLQISYKKIEPISPEYKNVDQNIDVDFSSMDLISNRETLAALLEFASQVFEDQINSSKKPATASTSEGALKQQLGEPAAAAAAVVTPKKKKKNVVTALQVTAQVGALNLILKKGRQKISEFSLQDFEAQLELVSNDTLKVRASLSDVLILDLTPESTHFPVVVQIQKSLKQAKVFEVTFETFPPDENPGYEQCAIVAMNSLEAIALYRFLDELILYFTEISVINELGSAASEAASEIAADTAVAVATTKKCKKK